MSKWTDQAITSTPKADAPKDSWWAKPQLQTDYGAFAEQRDTEVLRMNQNRFGGRGKVHGDGLK